MLAGIKDDTGMIYIVLAIVLLLSLLAALGSWLRGRGLNRSEAESLFSDAENRNREEMERIQQKVEESARESVEAAEKARRQLLDTVQQLNGEIDHKLAEMRDSIHESHAQHSDVIRQNMGSLENNMTRAITDARDQHDTVLSQVVSSLSQIQNQHESGMTALTDSLSSMRNEIQRAADQVRGALMEMTRQQQEAKAHSAIQLCEALMSSLSTLKTTIQSQVASTSEASLIEPTTTEKQHALSGDSEDLDTAYDKWKESAGSEETLAPASSPSQWPFQDTETAPGEGPDAADNSDLDAERVRPNHEPYAFNDGNDEPAEEGQEDPDQAEPRFEGDDEQKNDIATQPDEDQDEHR
jgi:hypothetical protein